MMAKQALCVSMLVLCLIAAVEGAACPIYAMGINTGSVTCSPTANTASNAYGTSCWRTELQGGIIQGCDGVAGSSHICSDWNTPTSCCTIPITFQKIICSGPAGFNDAPTAAHFANCATCCTSSSGVTLPCTPGSAPATGSTSGAQIVHPQLQSAIVMVVAAFAGRLFTE